MMRELGVPILIGALVGVALAIVPLPDPAPEGTPPTVTDGEPDDGVRFLWAGPIMDAPRGDVLVLADPQRPDEVTRQGPCVHDDRTDQLACAPDATDTVTWHNAPLGTVAIDHAAVHCIRAPCPQPAAPWLIRAPTDEVRFDPQNHTVRLSLYAFNAQGELLASTAPAAQLDDFDLYGDYIPLSATTRWYMGNGTAPAGTATLPFGNHMAAAALDGLPVGGVATVHLEQHPYAWLVGELWLTGRIEAIQG